jgi:hypothetical protein
MLIKWFITLLVFVKMKSYLKYIVMIAPFSSYSPLCTSKFSIKFLVQFSYSLEFLQTGKNWCTCKSKQEIGICLIPGLITICSDKGNYWGILLKSVNEYLCLS